MNFATIKILVRTIINRLGGKDMSLHTLKANETAKILSLSSIDATLRRKLQVLGVCDGCELKMKQKMMFNGPCVVECNGRDFCIRNCDARKIEVAKG